MSSSQVSNADRAVIDGFGAEWTRFDQSGLSEAERSALFDAYFHLVPWEELGPASVALDAGCGSGRWASIVAQRVGHLHCLDASPDALASTRRNLAARPNCTFHCAPLDHAPLDRESIDFVYCLGVLHHLPDPAAGLQSLVGQLRVGGFALIYVYYALDGRPAYFRVAWRMADTVRRLVSRAPYRLRALVADIIAFGIYWPLSRTARLLEWAGVSVTNLPLAQYRHRSPYVLRTDALDRFGTRIEHRFKRSEVIAMMTDAGLFDIIVSDREPYWIAIGRKPD